LSYEKEKAKIVDAEIVQLSEGATHGERETH
jgi:hypothetical protein